MAVRRAIGARGIQLLRQLASESLLLSLAGGAVGVLIARALVGVYRRLTPARYVVDVPFDWRVMGFTLGLAMAIGVLIALATGWQALRANVSGVLGRSGMTVARPTRRLRHALVIPQVAVSLLLLLVAGVHVRALAGIEGAPVGIALGDTAMFDVGWIDDGAPALRRSTPAMAEEQAARSRAFLRSLLDGLHGALGTAAGTVALTDRSPIEDRAEPPSTFVSEAAVGGEVDAFPLSVSPGYFATIGTRVLAGREFDARDVRQSPLVAVVSQSVADRLWPDQSAIGRRLAQAGASTSRSQPAWLTVIGVVVDVHPILRPSAATPMVYVSLRQQWRPSVKHVITRTAGMPASLVATVTQVVRTTDAQADVLHARRLAQIAGEMLYSRRTAAAILTLSGLIGLLLAATGLYAVVSQSIAQRVRELSIRIAVGADRWAVIALVLREGLLVAAVGIAIGVPLSLVALRVTATLVGTMPTEDPLTFLFGIAVVAGATLLACYGPARRAASVDPIEALRSE
jgi:predicted permease